MPPKRPRQRNKEVEMGGCEGMSSTNTRILELRKEKSRDAARSRRGKENYEFYELAKLLPLPAAITSQLDKASIIRLSISYLKLRDFSSHGDPPWNRDGPPPNKSIKGGVVRRRNMTAVAMEIFESHQGTHILQSLDGFGFALANDGRFLYISETVSIYLGLSQVEMTGSSVFDYVHVKDHPELAEHLGLAIPQGGMPSPGSLSDDGSNGPTSRSASPSLSDKGCLMSPNPSKTMDRSFCIRMKSTLTKRGVHVKSSGYRVVHILGHHRPQFSFSLNRKQSPPLLGMVCMAIALPPPTITELRMECDTFVMRFSPELKILYCEPRIAELMDLTSEDVTGSSLYEHCHAGDLHHLRQSHLDLLRKGQVMTDYYRLMNKHGGFIWIETCATTICSAKNLEEQNVVAINFVVSGIELPGCVMDTAQLKSQPKRESDSDIGSDTGTEPGIKRRKGSQDEVPHEANLSENGGTSTKTLIKVPETKRVQHNRMDNDISIEHSKVSPQSAGLVEDAVFHERVENQKLECKNSRRKMERPRKRRRESDTEIKLNGLVPYQDEMSLHRRLSAVQDSHEMPNSETRLSPNITSSPPHLSSSDKSPIPEDLSVKNSLCSTVEASVTSVVDLPNNQTNNSNSSTDVEWPKSNSVDKTPDEALPSSSVKDLEEAMNKHLPMLPTSSSVTHQTVDTIADSQADASCLHSKQKSTIQWIGSQQPSSDPLAASNLLRSLYANRESVIRTNICNSRPHYYGESVALNMLTPPGSESYKDPSALSLHPLQYPGSKSSTNHHPNMSPYSNSPITVSMTTHVTDTSYNMTPPSSVSPQDKFVSPFSDATFSDSSAQCQTLSEPSCQRLHVKPQLYSVPMPAHLPSYSDRSSHLSYPSISSYNSTGTSFPSYSTSPATLGAETNGSWYPTHFATP